MGDAFWNLRQSSLHQSPGSAKRHRPEFDLTSSSLSMTPEIPGYIDQKDESGGARALKDTTSIGSAYDYYLRNSRLPSEEESHHGQVGSGRGGGGDLPAFSMRDPVAAGRPESFGPNLSPSARGPCFGGPLPVDRVARPPETLPLPPDASNTLYIEGLPSDITKREVAHIFRPFVGYKEVRIVRKESKHLIYNSKYQRGGDPLILSFVDFADAACAATALSALQGYKMDEHDPYSPHLRLQFSKFPGPRTAAGPRGRR